MAQEERSDEQIVAAVISGDRDAFGELIVRYEEKLMRYARRFLANKEDREDLLQDVFLRAYVNLRSFDTSKRFSPWIYRIAHNAFVNELASQKRRPILMDVFSSDVFFPSGREDEEADARSIKEEEKKEIEEKLSILDPKYREPIILFYFDELNYEDIADVLHIPVATVGVRLKRGREMLKKHYQHNEPAL